MSAHRPTGRHEDVPCCEYAMLLEARKRSRTCREGWPDEETTWCEPCGETRKRAARATSMEDLLQFLYLMPTSGASGQRVLQGMRTGGSRHAPLPTSRRKSSAS
jgi:hypothetical protein